MIPREKAAQLIVDNQLKVKSLGYNEAIQCALITVDEIYKALKDTLAPAHGAKPGQDYKFHNTYWQQVKQEIEKMQ